MKQMIKKISRRRKAHSSPLPSYRKLSLLIVNCSLLIAFSCQDVSLTSSNPVTYDNQMVDELIVVQQEFNHFFNALTAKNETAVTQLEKTKRQVTNSLKVVQDLPSFEGSSVYKNAVIAVFKFQLKSIEQYYPEIIKASLIVEPTDEEMERMDRLYETIDDQEEPLDDYLMQVRMDFAKEHGFKYEGIQEE